MKEETIAPAPSTTFSIRALSANYLKASTKPVLAEPKWVKPPPNYYKKNVDTFSFLMDLVQQQLYCEIAVGEAVGGAS